jgi:hypothetical protein
MQNILAWLNEEQTIPTTALMVTLLMTAVGICVAFRMTSWIRKELWNIYLYGYWAVTCAIFILQMVGVLPSTVTVFLGTEGAIPLLALIGGSIFILISEKGNLNRRKGAFWKNACQVLLGLLIGISATQVRITFLDGFSMSLIHHDSFAEWIVNLVFVLGIMAPIFLLFEKAGRLADEHIKPRLMRRFANQA